MNYRPKNRPRTRTRREKANSLAKKNLPSPIYRLSMHSRFSFREPILIDGPAPVRVSHELTKPSPPATSEKNPSRFSGPNLRSSCDSRPATMILSPYPPTRHSLFFNPPQGWDTGAARERGGQRRDFFPYYFFLFPPTLHITPLSTFHPFSLPNALITS